MADIIFETRGEAEEELIRYGFDPDGSSISQDEIIDEVKAELDSEGIAYSKNVELGCMIETPAAAVISDGLVVASKG